MPEQQDKMTKRSAPYCVLLTQLVTQTHDDENGGRMVSDRVGPSGVLRASAAAGREGFAGCESIDARPSGRRYASLPLFVGAEVSIPLPLGPADDGVQSQSRDCSGACGAGIWGLLNGRTMRKGREEQAEQRAGGRGAVGHEAGEEGKSIHRREKRADSQDDLYSLDAEALEQLKPIHALIFLFKYVGGQGVEQAGVEVDAQDCGVWFCNQVSTSLPPLSDASRCHSPLALALGT